MGFLSVEERLWIFLDRCHSFWSQMNLGLIGVAYRALSWVLFIICVWSIFQKSFSYCILMWMMRHGNGLTMPAGLPSVVVIPSVEVSNYYRPSNKGSYVFALKSDRIRAHWLSWRTVATCISSVNFSHKYCTLARVILSSPEDTNVGLHYPIYLTRMTWHDAVPGLSWPSSWP